MIVNRNEKRENIQMKNNKIGTSEKIQQQEIERGNYIKMKTTLLGNEKKFNTDRFEKVASLISILGSGTWTPHHLDRQKEKIETTGMGRLQRIISQTNHRLKSKSAEKKTEEENRLF